MWNTSIIASQIMFLLVRGKLDNHIPLQNNHVYIYINLEQANHSFLTKNYLVSLHCNFWYYGMKIVINGLTFLLPYVFYLRYYYCIKLESEFWFKILLSFRRKITQWGHGFCVTFSSLVGMKVTTTYLMDYVLSWGIHNFLMYSIQCYWTHDLCHMKNLYSIM
jgi:hypothetical protein